MEVKRDLSMMNIIEVAQEFAKKDHSSYESFIFIALSQCGPGELIVGVDGRKVILEQVMSEFRPCNSTSLKNKPKLFFILRFVNLKTQSAERRSGGTEFFTDTTIALPHSCNTSIQEVCSEEADFLVACATSPIVKEKKITLPQHSFIEMMVNAVRGYHQTYNVLEMLTLLNHWTDNLHKKNGQSNVMVPYVTHTLRHNVRFDSVQTQKPQISTQSSIPDLYSLSRYDEQKTECRGYCIIINNLKFQENDEAYRGGSEQDEERLGNLFKSLRFEVIIKRNLEKNQIEEVAQEYGGKNHDKFAVFVLIVMSHGDNRDCILGVDNRMTSVRALMREFQAERCPSLKGKPKILIIQTCRGSRQCDVESINADPTEFDLADNCVCPFSLESSLLKSVFPPETDFLLAFATVPSYVSLRSPTSGAFFIQELVEVIEEYHGSRHLLDMLTEVTRRVIDHQNRAFDPTRYRVQVPAPTHTLTKLLYL
ncbi:caspase-3-like [Acropora palmata]|uniref:caspase-3-like n=1 Tax=Acropora palmata TaxID=6131 RepID=UPI003DA0F994